MVDKLQKNKYVILLLIVGAVFLFLRFIIPIFSPILIAMFIVIICRKPLQYLWIKFHIKKQYSMFLVVSLLFLILGTLGVVGISLIQSHINEWSISIDSVEHQLEDVIKQGCKTIELYAGVNATYIENIVFEQIDFFISDFNLQVIPSVVYGSFEYMKKIASIGAYFLILFIAVLLFAKDYDEIMKQVSRLEGIQILLEVIEKIGLYFLTFLKAQLIIITMIGILAAVVLGVLKIPYGIAFGILAGVLDALPFIGTGIVLVPLALWQFLNGNVGIAIGILILYVACIMIRECMEPKLIGDKLGIYPIVILLSIYGGLIVFGISGLIKGPLGLIMGYQIYVSLKNRGKIQKE